MAEEETAKQVEREILRKADLFQRMVTTEAWKEYVILAESHIKTRTSLIMTPVHALGSEIGVDFLLRASALESVKGAVIGLQLAMTLPSVMILAANEIRQDQSPDDDDDGDR